MKALEEKPIKVAKEVQQPPKAAPEEVEKEEPVPTAMEMALREAMERSKSKEPSMVVKTKKKQGANQQIEDILSRTLQNKVRTGK
jgi:20S proteasome alpha/beta subunit